jgi:hypothetical protein
MHAFSEQPVRISYLHQRPRTAAPTGNGGVQLLNVTDKILAKVLEYCYDRAHSPASSIEVTGTLSSDAMLKDHLKNFNEAFLDVDQGTMFDLILANNYKLVRSAGGWC